MQGGGGGGGRPCRFGTNCRNLAQGNCTFYHPPGEVANPNPKPQGPFGGRKPNYHDQDRQGGQGGQDRQGGYNGQDRQGGHGGGGQDRQGGHGGGGQDRQGGNYNNNRNNYNNREGGSGGSNYNGGGGGGGGSGHSSYNGGGGSGGNNYNGGGGGRAPMGGNRNSDDPIQGQLCRDFHIRQECKFGERCNRKHGFVVNSEAAIRRCKFMRELPFHPICKLTKFSSGAKDFYGMRNNHEVDFFDFNWETKLLGSVFKYKLPDPNWNYSFYDHKNEHVYYARQNPDMLYQDMGVYNVTSMKNNFVANSHQGKITGVAHFSEGIIISSSMAGELKVWVPEGETLVNHVESTQRLKSLFNPQNAKVELYFVDVTELKGTKIIAVGTSDGRLLFFFGENLDFRHVMLGEQYVKLGQY